LFSLFIGGQGGRPKRLARRGLLHVENFFSPTTQASGFAASPEFTPDVSSLACLSMAIEQVIGMGSKIPNLPDNSNYLRYCSVYFASKQPKVVGKPVLFYIGVMKNEMNENNRFYYYRDKKFRISFTILTFLLQFDFCPCSMYIFYWYASTPNSIGGLPASCAPISGAAPV